MSRGIYLVTNRRSEREAAQLVYSLRHAGCRLPIALIPFDGQRPTHPRLLAETTFMEVESFPAEGRALLGQIAELWPESKPGLFRRLLAWYGPFDEFIYSDNDIVALADWTPFFDYLDDNHFVHADTEYTTGGIYAYARPAVVQEKFGRSALDSLFTTGHFASRKSPQITAAFEATVPWIRTNPEVAWKVDGSFLHLAVLVGALRIRNLCAAPESWPSPWAWDYRNAMELVQATQRGGKLFQLHFSGGIPDGFLASHELYFSDFTDEQRLRHYVRTALKHWSGFDFVTGKLWRGLKRRWAKASGK